VKKLFLAFAAALVLSATPAMAEVKAFANPGELSVGGGVGLNFYGSYLGFSLVPGAELGLTQFVLSPQFPINVGVSGRGYYSSYSYNIGSGYTYGWTYIGLGAYGTAHWSPKFLGLQGDFWSHLDYYIALGVDFTMATVTGTYADWYKSYYGKSYSDGYGGGLGLGAYSGVAYYINNNLAVYLEGTSFAGSGGTVVGVKLTL
jgi:hypothetical protein